MSRIEWEAAEQEKLIQWTELVTLRIPEIALLFAVPNGGHRHRAVAAKLKAQGVRAGVPDLCLPVPRGHYHGLFIEMKYGNNRPSPLQKWWLDQLQRQGYRTVVCWSYDEARVAIESYLALPPAPEPKQEAA